MFIAERWAAAFTSLAPEKDWEYSLELLKVLCPLVKSIPGKLSGLTASQKVEKIIRAAFAESSVSGQKDANELCCKLLALLVKRGYVERFDDLIKFIEYNMDKKRGVIPAVLESAEAVDEKFKDELSAALKQKTGAAGIRLKTVIQPELLGGYRLNAAGFLIDASLRGSLLQMTQDLGAVNSGGKASHGGISW